MFRTTAVLAASVLCLALATTALAQTNNPNKPTWWDKYQYLAANGPETCTGDAGFKVGPNVMCPTSVVRKARRTSRSTLHSPKGWPAARTKFFACRCAVISRPTAARRGVGSTCRSRRPRATA